MKNTVTPSSRSRKSDKTRTSRSSAFNGPTRSSRSITTTTANVEIVVRFPRKRLTPQQARAYRRAYPVRARQLGVISLTMSQRTQLASAICSQCRKRPRSTRNNASALSPPSAPAASPAPGPVCDARIEVIDQQLLYLRKVICRLEDQSDPFAKLVDATLVDVKAYGLAQVKKAPTPFFLNELSDRTNTSFCSFTLPSTRDEKVMEFYVCPSRDYLSFAESQTHQMPTYSRPLLVSVGLDNSQNCLVGPTRTHAYRGESLEFDVTTCAARPFVPSPAMDPPLAPLRPPTLFTSMPVLMK